MSHNCLFCLFAKSSDSKIYETERVFAIADKMPLSTGHILVIPKTHAQYLHEMDLESMSEILPTIKKIVELLGYKSYNVLQNNKHMQSIFHVHFHIIPFNSENNKMKLNWDAIKLSDDEYSAETKRLQELVRIKK